MAGEAMFTMHKMRKIDMILIFYVIICLIMPCIKLFDGES